MGGESEGGIELRGGGVSLNESRERQDSRRREEEEASSEHQPDSQRAMRDVSRNGRALRLELMRKWVGRCARRVGSSVDDREMRIRNTPGLYRNDEFGLDRNRESYR